MNFQLTEEQLAVQAAARDFAQNELLPGVIERDTHQKFPTEQIRKMGELGFMGMMVNPKYNGGGMDTVSYTLAIEELSKVDASASVCMSVNNSLVCWGLEKFGSEEQKEKYLKKLASGEQIGAFCLSEPEAGSDATSQRTTAEDKGDYYLLNGTKNWITNGNSSGICIVIAQTDPVKRHKGINALIVEKGWPGFVVGKKEDKMGIRGSDTHSLMFTDVKVPKANRIGPEGFGFTFAMTTLNGGRIGIASQALGIAASRRAPGNPVQACRYGDADRRSPAVDLAGRFSERSGQRLCQGRSDGKIVCVTNSTGCDNRSGADPRRIWVRKRISCRTPDA
jgi:alkylation response protein AidB-like acyl-CoA dehydrogenase